MNDNCSKSIRCPMVLSLVLFSLAAGCQQQLLTESPAIHPDEILADNFVHLVNQTKDLASPEIVAAMREQLAR